MNKSIFYFLFLLFFVSCRNSDQGEELKTIQANVSYVDSVIYRNDMAPDFYWTGVNGELVNFKKIHKKITIINFWATWCSPCRKEIPDLISINSEYASKGVRVIGISTDKGGKVIADVSDFVKAHKIDYPIIIDNGKLSDAFGNIRGLPTTFFIDEEGKIAKKFMGIKTKDFFVAQIEDLMK